MDPKLDDYTLSVVAQELELSIQDILLSHPALFPFAGTDEVLNELGDELLMRMSSAATAAALEKINAVWTAAAPNEVQPYVPEKAVMG